MTPDRTGTVPALEGLREDLRALGVVWMSCDAAGTPCGDAPPPEDFVATLLARAPGVRRALAERIPSLDGVEARLQQGARHLGRFAQIVEIGGHAPEHPIHPAIPETRYLKALVCRVVAE